MKSIRLRLRIDATGLLLGAVFLAFSLTPSLLPRPPLAQGVLSGLSFSAGYALGAAVLALWRYLQLSTLPVRRGRRLRRLGYAACGLLVALSLWRSASWQTEIHGLMGMEEPAGTSLFMLLFVASFTFALVLGLARLFRWSSRALSRRLERHAPPRLASVLAMTASVMLFWTAIDGVLFRFLLQAADRSFQQLDALIDDDLPRPAHPDQAGSADSLVDWEDLGRQGRKFVAEAPGAAEISAFFGRPQPRPLRVYVGLNSADTPTERARLALAELIRVGGFERSVLLLVTPTGTGWIDPAGQDTVEYLLRGDVATVAAQYSYLSSPLALLTEGEYGTEMARALFQAIYDHWRSLPAAQRPRLYLQGLSLGALNSDASFDFYDIIDAPFDGALWVGPPFRHETWRNLTAERRPDSPFWLPRIRDGAVARFMNQQGGLAEAPAAWGAFRIAFLQYGSDPITFFNPRYAWRKPEWLHEPRAPDVSPELRWFPVVTMLQLAGDMLVGTAPRGFGHEYAATHYIDAWVALIQPGGWSEEELARLRGIFQSL